MAKVIMVQGIMSVISDSHKNVYGTYIHGVFDQGRIANTIVQILSEKKEFR